MFSRLIAPDLANPDVMLTVSDPESDTGVVGSPPDRIWECPHPAVGDRVDAYLLQSKLGQGVSCFVFRGWDERHQSPVALKIVNWDTAHDRAAVLRQIRAEAAGLARVNHPRVVRFIDFGRDPRWPYLVTEFVDGRPLGDLIRVGGALPPAWAVALVSQAADGLGAVWRAGLVHRDVKPDNLLVAANGAAKLIDFGLAKTVTAEPTGEPPEVAGTAAYLAPEQAADAAVVDLRADVYSLGVTFYEALTGRLPFPARSRMQMLYHHAHTPPTPPAEVDSSIPPLASELCLWMLGKNPADRPQTADELRRAFAAVAGG